MMINVVRADELGHFIVPGLDIAPLVRVGGIRELNFVEQFKRHDGR